MTLSLRSQIILALFTLAAIFVTLLTLQSRSFEQALNDQSMLTEGQSLLQQINTLQRRGAGYAAVAPRDWESYNRDVAVIYSGWQEDLAALQQNVTALATRARTQFSDDAGIMQQLQTLQDAYQGFRNGLNEKIGDNPERPRLEWGAEYLAAQSPVLSERAQSFNSAVTRQVQQHVDRARSQQLLAWAVAATALLLIVAWFWFRVIRRIGSVNDSCRAVSAGEFGTRAPEAGRDELSTLARSFNQLSSRTRVVLGMLDKLPADAPPADVFDLLWSESADHLGHHWQGLFDVNPLTRVAVLTAQQQREGVDFNEQAMNYPMRAMLQEMADQGSTVWSLDNLRHHTLEQAESRLLRELSRRGMHRIAVVLLQDPANQRSRLLAFAWPETSVDHPGTSRFLASLSRFFSSLLLPQERPAAAARASTAASG